MHDRIAFVAAFFALLFSYSVFIVVESIQGPRRSPRDAQPESDPDDTFEALGGDGPSSAVGARRSAGPGA